MNLYRITVERRQEDTQLIYAENRKEAVAVALKLNVAEPVWETVYHDADGWNVNFGELLKGETAWHPDSGWRIIE